jgi:hypothetical protein
MTPSSGRASWVLAVPFALLLLLALGAVGWFVAVQVGGRAHGDTARIEVQPACPAGRQAIRDRLDAYGLPVVREDADALVVQLPGLPDDLVHMPQALAAPGVLSITTATGAPVPARVRHAGVQMSLSGQPVTLLTLDVALPDGIPTVTVDGAAMEVEAVNGGELQLLAGAEDASRALRLASDRAVQLRFPLPCAVSVTARAEPG